ncbi:MAG: glycoside hydrolase family 97 protein [Spirosomataceae bacterium]
MKKRLFFYCYLLGISLAKAQTYTLSSPDFKLQLSIENLGNLRFSATYEGKTILSNAEMSLELSDERVLGQDAKIRSAKPMYQKNTLKPEVTIKNAEIIDEFNELNIQFRDGYQAIFRAYNDAIAYRFVTTSKDSMLYVKNEKNSFQLSKQSIGFWQKIGPKENFINNYERLYEPQSFATLGKPLITQLPLLVKNDSLKISLLFTETDVDDYPGMYLEATPMGELASLSPMAVKSTRSPVKPENGWDRSVIPTERFDYLAHTRANRPFPWRIIAIAKEDKELLTNEITYKLAPVSKLPDISWIKPGKVAWDWWNDWNLTGVPFRAGINNNTYKVYIDFAANHGIEYVLLDDGWYTLGDLTKETPGISVQSLVEYGKQKNVGVFLWVSWKTLDEHMETTMDVWQKWGVKGIKVDFMDRDDQTVVTFYERCAKEAAKRKLMVDFHGSFKPVGLHRAYPNVLNYEGVMGLEQNKWSGQNANPAMAVTIPFIRMVAGPLDYTPGAMLNAQPHEYAPNFHKPMSLGTRCHQLGMYVLYDAPLQMLADSPIHYEREPECLEFLSRIPTTWDKTVAIGGQVGEYAALARQKGAEWFVGALNNWKPRAIELNMSFLPEGAYQLDLWQDGLNADKTGTDFQVLHRTVTNKDTLTMPMAPGGGLAGRIKIIGN